MRAGIRVLMVAAAAAWWTGTGAFAQAPQPDLTRASIEDLMNITITSASRKEERAVETAAGVYVITREEIRRSGFTSLPDLLRLAPGVQVAQINSSKWAVSVRGFNGLFSNKLLVLLDGRSVYNHLFSGVLWDTEDLPAESIERIEVIRGPGAAVWGANAVNGVINILTRSAADTRGALVQVGAGTFEPGQVSVRYGGAVGRVDYRVFSQWTSTGDTRLVDGGNAQDGWQRATAGFRTDWNAGPRTFMLQGNMTRARGAGLWIGSSPAPAGSTASIPPASAMSRGAVLGRWTRQSAHGGSLQVQSALDLAHRDEPVGDYRRRTADVEVQYHTTAPGRQDIVAGGGYRYMREQVLGRNGYSLTPDTSNDYRVDVFAQDEIKLAAERLHLTVASRLERDALAGWGWQPTARLAWAAVPQRQFLWVATSRALRTPSLTDRGIRFDSPAIAGPGPLPIRVTTVGSPAARTEVLSDVETGYRAQVTSAATVAVTGFYGRYDHLVTPEVLAPTVVLEANGPYLAVPVRLASGLRGNSSGVEVDAQWMPFAWWRLDTSYSAYRFAPTPNGANADAVAANVDANAPRHQWQLRSALSLPRKTEVDLSLYHVGRLAGLAVPAYLRADARLQVPLTPRLTLAVVGQNLIDATHVEFRDSTGTVIHTRVPRSARVQLAWGY